MVIKGMDFGVHQIPVQIPVTSLISYVTISELLRL